jgi:HPt (histidine-containing phosphotransfer) domain-containing protein
MSDHPAYDTPFRIVPDPDLADLVPDFISRRHADLALLTAALSAGDLATIRATGHSIKGSGGGYGFDGLTEIGARLESSGAAGDADAAAEALHDLADYLENVEVVYE